MPESKLQVEAIVSFPFEENTYIAHFNGHSACLVFDPGLEPQKIGARLKQAELDPQAFLCTHGHSDHIGGNAYLKAQWPEVPLIIGEGDAPKLTDAVLNLSAPFGIEIISPPADRLVREGDVVEAAGIRLEVLEIPGHSCGHVVFLWKGEPQWIVFGGDVLFAGGVGRTDFPDGDPQALLTNIHLKLFTLPPDTIVYPGHGLPTTIGDEIESNPWAGKPAGYRP